MPVLTVPGRDKWLRAFINPCRHRGAKVASGTAQSFTCPDHAWSYRDDGLLRAVPEAACFPGVLESRAGSTALQLAEKLGMVWVVPTPAGDRSPDLDIGHFLDGLTSDRLALVRDLLLVEVDATAVDQAIARSARSGLRRNPDISAV